MKIMEPEIKEIKLNNDLQTVSVKPKGRFLNRKLVAILGGVLLILILFAGVAVLAVGMPAYKVYKDAMIAVAYVQETKEAAKAQDISKITESLAKTKAQVLTVQNGFSSLLWTKNIPYFGNYTADAEHLIKAGIYGLEAGEIGTAAIEPYADLLGLKGKGTFAGGTTEDRIAKAIATLEKVTPQIDAISEKVKLVQNEIKDIDPNRYPQEINGRALRPLISDFKNIIKEADLLLDEAKPLVKVLPKQLGQPTEAKYLVIFQNDAELRPTGGFMTAYAVLRVEKGKINLDTADDIYKLDSTVTKNIKPPQAIKDYLNESVYHLRNTNFSPDFVKSMEEFTFLYNSSPERKKINGIITVDTQVLIRILDILGPVDVYGTTFTTKIVPQCDCPQIIWELEKYADEPTPYLRKDRKDIIGVLLTAIMQKAMKAPKDKWAPLFMASYESMLEKHILVYFYDPDAQKGMVALGGAGVIKPYNGDYLHINDANLGGAKSNLYVTQAVKQEVKVMADGTETVLTIDYKHPRRSDNCSLERKSGVCLSGTLRDYLRVYLPKGSQIIETRGFEVKGTKETKGESFEDLDKTVIDGFFTVTPLGLARIQITYKTPVKFSKEYRELIQKQPGTDGPHYKVTVNGKTSEFDLLKDKELIVPL